MSLTGVNQQAEEVDSDSPTREAELAVVRATRDLMVLTPRDKITMDDVCMAAGISRATLYRLFPGGRDVLFDAVRETLLEEFFAGLRSRIEGADTLEELLVRVIVAASCSLRDDSHLAASLATEPGRELENLTLDGLHRIIRVATGFITPFASEFIPASETEEIVDILARLVISYYLSPSKVFDFTKRASAVRFVRSHLLPAVAVQ